jgi:hypothetical protein
MGVRAARLREIVNEIRMHFADPAFSPQDIAHASASLEDMTA